MSQCVRQCGILTDFLPKVSDGNKVWTAILVFLIICGFSAYVVFYSAILDATLFVQLSSSSNVAIGKAQVVVTLVTDLALALSLVFLIQRRRAGNFPSTDSVLKVIIAYTIGTSLLTTLCLLIVLILIIVFPDSFVWLACDLLVCKREPVLYLSHSLSDYRSVYVNCMFVSCVIPLFHTLSLSLMNSKG